MSDLHKDELHSQAQYRMIEELSALEDRYSKLIDLLHVVVFNCDRDGRMVFISPAWTEILGYSRSESLNRFITDFIYEKDRELWVSLVAKQQENIVKHKEMRFYCRNGEVIWFELSVQINRYGDKVGLLYDITERKEFEKERQDMQMKVIHAEKLGAIGRLSASIAHEFNNPIFGIRNVLEHLIKKITMDTRNKEYVDMAIHECDRMAGFIRKLQDFYRPSFCKTVSINIHALIDDVLVWMREEWDAKKIELVKDYAANMPEIAVIPDQIKQVILNMLNNAEDAIARDGGKISIRTEALKTEIKIHIQDSGNGIKEEDMEHIFEPFFTTKGVKGMGLGLSVSYGIIKQHGGEIKVKSRLGNGTTFTIILPVKGVERI